MRRAGAEIWGKARSPGWKASRGTPGRRAFRPPCPPPEARRTRPRCSPSGNTPLYDAKGQSREEEEQHNRPSSVLSGGWTAGASAARLGGGGAEATASGVPREAFHPGDLAFPQISAPRARPSPPVLQPSGNTSVGTCPRPRHGKRQREEMKGAWWASTTQFANSVFLFSAAQAEEEEDNRGQVGLAPRCQVTCRPRHGKRQQEEMKGAWWASTKFTEEEEAARRTTTPVYFFLLPEKNRRRRRRRRKPRGLVRLRHPLVRSTRPSPCPGGW